VRALGAIHGIRIVGFAERHYVATVLVAGVSSAPNARALQIDFYLCLTWKGLPYLEADLVVQSAICFPAGNSTFLVPSSVHEAIISLFAGLLLGGLLKEKYFLQAQRTFTSDRTEVIAALLPKFGLKATTRMVDAVIAGNRHMVLACVGQLRASLASRNLAYRPISSIQNIARHYAREIVARFTPEDLETINILGLDWCKSTVIEGLMPTLRSSSVVVERRRSGPLQPLALLSSGATETADVDAQTEDSSLSSMVRIVLWLLEEWRSQFIGDILPTLRICESYYYDLLFLPKSYRSADRGWLARLVAKLLPSADLWIVLDHATNGLQSMSEQVIPAQTSAQLGAFRALDEAGERFVVLDANQPSDRVIESAYITIIDTLAQRADKRLKSRF
jgi:hypothetical protein